MFLHVRGFTGGGFCFMIDDKAVSVQEALIQNGGRFHKATINALNRKNLFNESDLKAFEVLAESLHKGLTPCSIRQILRNDYGIDVLKTDYLMLSSSQVEDLKTVYKYARYKVPTGYVLKHSPMYYFYRYLSNVK
ncbi:hypothetical protein pEaSNUABM50_00007 [Erwinia phage pEa_SNUABM_50]|uniref:Uncharacterized protein n=1 Tax=Erwinia phage pEa_SNUABM_50 TaxID=2768775 RepID=A0A7L8ZQ12_9CAUD|nr:hypothetical protein pEaSNUABM50_00007 [Erwinia phage pEa_SNUABM_50]QXO11154.1 hypothetical protein pEaSNUABM19_00008 [Erwinia phage pEa_SNUABM_19]